jgi:hypothetical protein
MDRPHPQSRHGAPVLGCAYLAWLQNALHQGMLRTQGLWAVSLCAFQSGRMPSALVKKKARGRHQTTVHGKRAGSRHSLKQSRSQKEPCLLGISPQLAALSAKEVVRIYAGRMQIEQTFRDVKNPRWGLALSESQTRKPQRLAILLLIGALTWYALWLIGVAIRTSGYRIEFDSKTAAQVLSVISLAR